MVILFHRLLLFRHLIDLPFQIVFVVVFFNLLVRQYVPKPLHCFKCHRFGHTQEHCMSHAICISCGQKAHSPPCQSSPHCINCDGPQCSNSHDCPKFQMEREIQKISATDKVSFADARRFYQSQHLVNFSRSFVSVLKSSNSSSYFQTTRPTRHSVHFQDTLTSLIGDQDESPQLLKIITPTVKPTAKPPGAEPSSSALSSIDLPTSTSSSETPLEEQPLHLATLLARDYFTNHDLQLGTHQLLVTLLVTQTIRRELMVAQVRS